MLELDLKRLKAERVARGITVPELANKLGMSKNNYYNRECGRVDMGANELAKVCEALGISKEGMYIFFTKSVPEKERNKEATK